MNIRLKVFAALPGQAAQSFGRLVCHGRKVHRDYALGVLFFVGAGDEHKLLHQLVHAGYLFEGGSGPFVFAAEHLGKFRVGADHGQGRFKLVAGVGDELFLTLGVLDHRADGQPGKRAHQPVNDEQPGQTDDDGDGRQAIGGVDAVLIIEGGDDRAAVGPLLVLVKIGAVLPEGLFLGEHFFARVRVSALWRPSVRTSRTSGARLLFKVTVK